MTIKTNDEGGQQQRGCNVSSAFNLTVGFAAIIAALLIAYFGYTYWPM